MQESPEPGKIELTRGQVTLVDFEDWQSLRHMYWFAVWDVHAKSFYAARARIRPETKRMLLHRWIMGDPVGFVIDHINHNTLDNRRSNLRVATTAQNVANSILKKNKSGVRGVYWHKRDQCWTAGIGTGGKLLNLGYFATMDEAVAAREEAVKHYQGEFACRI